MIDIKKFRREKKIGQKKLSEILGVTQGYFSQLENGIYILSEDNIKRLKEYYPDITNFETNILANKDASLIDPINDSNKQNDPIINSSGNRFYLRNDGLFDLVVDEIPFPAHGKYVSEDEEYYAEWGKETFIVDRVNPGNFLGFKHVGDSMYNPDEPSEYDIKEGEKSLGKELSRWHWQGDFNPKRALLGWVLITKKNILHKDILNYDANTGMFKLGSRNPDPKHAPFDMPINDVYQIFKIVKKK